MTQKAMVSSLLMMDPKTYLSIIPQSKEKDFEPFRRINP